MYKVLFAASEVHPLIKTGGLGDVAGILPTALFKLGWDVGVILPAYPNCKQQLKNLVQVTSLSIPSVTTPVIILKGELPGVPVTFWLVDSPRHFNRPGNPYIGENGQEWPDNADRFATFCKAIVHGFVTYPNLDWKPDVIHCNDWHTGLIPPLLDSVANRPVTMFTIHNLSYQGVFPYATFQELQLPNHLWLSSALAFHNQLSFMKGGLIFSDWLTTVSPSYAKEIMTPELGCGLDDILRQRFKNLTGILNGADYDRWDPVQDSLIEKPYNKESWYDKVKNKLALQRQFHLPENKKIPMFGFIGRLVTQKGIDLIIKILPKIISEQIQIIFLGEGEEYYQSCLETLARKYPEKIGLSLGYSETLAHSIQAGVDIFLMPSYFEPCGLTQIYALRYGTIPIVHKVGGLADTIIDATPENLDRELATGFIFNNPTSSELLHAIERCLHLYAQPYLWQKLILTGMAQDFNWKNSAKRYLELYYKLLQSRSTIE
ncbi:glycogen synthase GlgA [Candidatus Nitrosacidococcus tergens]|uniref:Glycogen synthase n=1 Tax=Candidatus Nitrosacidococcus tergens TaxID=553981 RepID=A0A7G1QAK6_9GAMM|nr:glycogen synthase GlgA [Candidatus Nitrosacidococcus tergens]CAB1276727.1 Glycogen synthase [Candidatus Nitrosacidococcus tergens]